MKLSESAQELLELLWVATEEDSKAGLEEKDTPPEGADELVRLELAKWEGKWLTPTSDGKPEAAKAIRRHRLGERLLADILSTEDTLLDEHACRLEHALFDGVDDSICTLLGHPHFCPHGRPIPPGECCLQMQDKVGRLVASLRDLQPGQQGKIAYIQMNSPRRLQKLMAMGALPGVPIKLLRRSPSFVFEVGYSQFAVDEEIATAIFVRLDQD